MLIHINIIIAVSSDTKGIMHCKYLFVVSFRYSFLIITTCRMFNAYFQVCYDTESLYSIIQ